MKIKNQNLLIFYKIVSWRLLFYSKETADIFKRRNQTLFTLALIVGPLIIPASLLYAKPILDFLRFEHPLVTMLNWASLLLLFILIANKQRFSISGGNMRKHLDIQPFNTPLELIIDFFILTIIDIFILVPFFIAMIYLIGTEINNVTLVQKIIFLFLSVLNLIVLQILTIRNSIYLYKFIIISFIAVYLCSIYKTSILSTTPLLFLFIYAIANLLNNHKEKPDNSHHKAPMIQISHHSKWYFSLILICFRYLFSKTELNKNILRLFLITISPFFLIIISNHIQLSFISIKIVLLSIIALKINNIGSMEYSLQNMNRPMLNYLSTHGITKENIQLSHILSLIILASVCYIPLSLSLFFFINSLAALIIFPLVISGIVFFSYLNRDFENVHVIHKLIFLTFILLSIWIVFDYFT